MAKLSTAIKMYDKMLGFRLARGYSQARKVSVSDIVLLDDSIYSKRYINRYYMIYGYPDKIERGFLSLFRGCCKGSTQVDVTYLCEPKPIDWGSAEMKSRMRSWSDFAKETSDDVNVFNFSEEYQAAEQRMRLIESTKFFNFMDLKYKRAIVHCTILLRVYARNIPPEMETFEESCVEIERLAKSLRLRMVRRNYTLLDELRAILPFSRSDDLKVNLPRRMMTDDMVIGMSYISQGVFGRDGTVLGLDVLNGTVVMHHFKEDPDKAENWLITATTGGGKSYFVKNMLMYLLADNFKVCIMDYEGDEYTNIANFIRGGNPSDVLTIQLGNGSGIYFDPCAIADPTGNEDLDKAAKSSAQDFITAMFKIMAGGEGALGIEGTKILSLAIQRMYDSLGVTEDMSTWGNSKKARIQDVYDEIVNIVVSGEFNNETDRAKHEAAVFLRDATSVFFEEGEVKYGTFSTPIQASDLYDANLVVFAFGMKGADPSSSGTDILALKQLSVAYVNILISNHCKYVQHRFNVKVWEEFQRWGAIEGSGSIITNCITGGRKRGDVHLIITNDIMAMLNGKKDVNDTLRQNIQNFAVGKLEKKAREEFTRQYGLPNILPELDNIANGKDGYDHAFCILTDDGEATTAKCMLPQSIARSGLYNTGVQIE